MYATLTVMLACVLGGALAANKDWYVVPGMGCKEYTGGGATGYSEKDCLTWCEGQSDAYIYAEWDLANSGTCTCYSYDGCTQAEYPNVILYTWKNTGK